MCDELAKQVPRADNSAAAVADLCLWAWRANMRWRWCFEPGHLSLKDAMRGVLVSLGRGANHYRIPARYTLRLALSTPRKLNLSHAHVLALGMHLLSWTPMAFIRSARGMNSTNQQMQYLARNKVCLVTFEWTQRVTWKMYVLMHGNVVTLQCLFCKRRPSSKHGSPPRPTSILKSQP